MLPGPTFEAPCQLVFYLIFFLYSIQSLFLVQQHTQLITMQKISNKSDKKEKKNAKGSKVGCKWTIRPSELSHHPICKIQSNGLCVGGEER